MTRIYPDESLDRLEATKEALLRMAESKDIVTFKNEFNSFLEAGNHCLLPFERSEFKKIIGFEEWDIQQTKNIKENKLFDFFRKFRNETLKASEDLISYSTSFEKPVSIHAGEGNVLQIVAKKSGIRFIRTSKENLSNSEVLKNVSGMNISNIRFNIIANKKLKNFLEFHEKEVIPLANDYMNALKQILDDFITKFAKL